LADSFKPDLVVGASIGALNGWAIAGGCDPDELIDRWLNLGDATRFRWKLPAGPFGGVLNSDPLQRAIRDIYESFTPRIEFATVLTDLLRLRPRIVRGSEVTWRHLVATTAIVGIFDQVRLDGRLYSDGGLLAAVPLWAAAELGATQALVLNILPETPGLVAKVFVGGMRVLSPFHATVPESVQAVWLTPSRLLGAPLESIYWTRENAERWARQGAEDAAEIKHSIADCFEAK